MESETNLVIWVSLMESPWRGIPRVIYFILSMKIKLEDLKCSPVQVWLGNSWFSGFMIGFISKNALLLTLIKASKKY